MLIGSHIGPDEDPAQAAVARGADCVQVFLDDPQSWKVEISAERVRALAAAGVPVYVHAPYVVNVASGNNRVRIPSRKLLARTCTVAAEIGAAGVIVHGGQVTGDDDVAAAGAERWRKALEPLETTVPVLIENTAGGTRSVARQVETIAKLWEQINGLLGASGPGICLDTCHAHAAGEDLATVVDRLRAATGRVDLVHANDSRDPAGSGRDRHANLGEGEIGLEVVAAVCRTADVPVICETPGGAQVQAADIAALRGCLQG